MPNNTAQRRSRCYKLPVQDFDFLLRDWGIRSTIVTLGSARAPSPEQAPLSLFEFTDTPEAACNLSGSRTLRQMQPRQTFFREYMPRWPEPGGLVERADMKMRFRRAHTFARQGRPAPRAESAQPAGRRTELRYLPCRHRIGITRKRHEHRDRRTAVLAAALAMAPCHADRLAPCHEAHRTA
jgi:hypothetical protein